VKAKDIYAIAAAYRAKRDYAERTGDWAAAERYQRLSDDTEREADETAAREAREARKRGEPVLPLDPDLYIDPRGNRRGKERKWDNPNQKTNLQSPNG